MQITILNKIFLSNLILQGKELSKKQVNILRLVLKFKNNFQNHRKLVVDNKNINKNIRQRLTNKIKKERKVRIKSLLKDLSIKIENKIKKKELSKNILKII
jgi:hypothetical protein